MSDRTESATTTPEIRGRHLSRAVLGAVVVSLYVVWMAADLVPRWLLFPVVAVLAVFLLYERTAAHEQAVFVGYALAAMLATTPFVMVVPDVTGGFGAGLSMVFTTANLLVFVIFVLVAGVVGYGTYRLDGGRGVLQRLRNRQAA